VHDLVQCGRKWTICEVTVLVGISSGLCQAILIEDFEMRFIPIKLFCDE